MWENVYARESECEKDYMYEKVRERKCVGGNVYMREGVDMRRNGRVSLKVCAKERV